VLAGTLALGLGLAGARGAAADDAPAVVVTRHVPTAEQALSAYAQNPLQNRRGLRQLEHDGTDTLPPVVLLAMGDARLRSGQRRAASRLFEAVLARDLGEPFESWARLGLGWNALRAGDVDAARPYLEEIAAAGTATSGLAKLLVALIDAGDGTRAAVETFDQVAADPSVSSDLREVGRLGGAYARYWAGDFRSATPAFEAVVRDYPASKLRDDAQYGAAWSRVRAGERAAGEAALRSLASDAPKHGPAVSEELVNLDPRALVRAGFGRYRRGPLRPPEDQMVELLDGDGRAMARAALRHLDEAPLASASLRRAVAVRPQADAEDGGRRGTSGAVRAPGARPAQQTAAPSPPSGRRGWYAFGAFLFAACLFVATRRHGAQSPPGRSTHHLIP